MSPNALSPDTTAIDRLRLRVPAGGDWAARRAVENASWPAVGDGAWVILREVRVRDAPGRVAARVAGVAEALLRTAPEAGTPGSEQGGAVRFADLAELLAWLCADLAAGRAADRWYWRRWRRLLDLGAAAASAQLLGDHAALLPGITAALGRIGALGPVWSALGPSQVLAVQARLALATGLSLPTPFQAPADPFAALGPDLHAGLTALPPTLRRRWAPVLGPMEPGDPRTWLAACVVALEWRPRWSGSATLLAALALRLAEPVTARPVGRIPDEAIGETGGLGILSVSGGAAEWSAADSLPSGRPSLPGESGLGADEAGWLGGPEAGAAARAPVSMGSGPLAGIGMGGDASRHGPSPGPGNARSGSAAAEADLQPPVTGAASDAGASAEGTIIGPPVRGDSGPSGLGDRISGQTLSDLGAAFAPPFTPPFVLETEEGGCFYLINFLVRPEAQAVLAGADGMGRWPEGWAWLWGLGRLLGLRPQGALARFIGERLGLPDPAAIVDLPPLPEGPALMDLGARLYGGEPVWGPDLLAVPARVRHSPTHLDCHYPLSAVRLSVRRAGLDLNPGWVPWLGRVVTLHYEDPGGWR